MKRVHISRSALAFGASAILLLVAGCGGESPTSPAGPETPEVPQGPSDGPGDPQSPLECGQKGYPCSLADVPLEVLERSDALADSVLAMVVDGATAAEAAAWLNTKDGMAEVQSNDLAIRFRLAGGRGTWVVLRQDELDGSSGAPVADRPVAAEPSAQTDDRARLRAIDPAWSDPGRANEIVGGNLKEKRALILSPFLWAFGAGDEGPGVEGILKNTRGYEGGVEFEHNDAAGATEVGLESFLEWGAYQVIHVSSHGERVCNEAGCRAIILVNRLDAILPGAAQTLAEKQKTLRQEGLEVTLYREPPGWYVSVTADFFRKFYQGGLDNTLVFVNACETYGAQATDLVDAIQGNSSVVLGWDYSVKGKNAKAAALALYGDLSEGGYLAEVAYDRLGDLKTGEPTANEPAPTLRMSQRPKGGDLRIRDIVTLLNPATDQELTASDVVNIDGTKNDDQPDLAPWLVRVDGMKQEEAEKAELHVTVDGVAAEPVPVSSGTVDDKDEWTISGTVPLGYDLTEDKAVTFRAWVEFPDEGQSDHEVVATLGGDAPLMGTTWEFVSTETVDEYVPHTTPYTATAHLTLTFAEGQDPKEPHPRYVITGGTVTVDYSHTYYDCTLNGSTTFDVTDEMTGVSELIFDTTLSPVGYSGILYTNGPEFEVQQNCGSSGSSTWTNNANNSWMEWTAGDGQTVSADRQTISGKECVGCDDHFIRESTYTITRIR